MIRRIAVPVEEPTLDSRALQYAALIAERSGAVLELVHVHVPDRPGAELEALPQFRFGDVAEFDDQCDRAAEDAEWDWLEELRDRVQAENRIAVSCRLLRGPVDTALWEHARASRHDLVVMACREDQCEGAVRSHRSDRVVRFGNVPVLRIRPSTEAPDAGKGLRRMLVTLDGSDFSESILSPAVGLAKTLGMEITLLRALSGTDPGDRELALAYLQAIADELPAEISSRILAVPHRSATEAILGTASNASFDLIAMATHGQGGFRHRVVGSTAHEVLRGSRQPVLMYRPDSLAARWYLAAREAFAPA
jgi:nucleotide-binding universal stress UspA family protein